MPTYEFRCEAGHSFDRFLKMSEAPLELACVQCGQPARRQMSGGAGLVFKGSGFYLTDYGRAGQKAPAAEGGESSGGDAKAADTKADGKVGDAKPAKKETATPATSGTSSASKSDKSSTSKDRKASE